MKTKVESPKTAVQKIAETHAAHVAEVSRLHKELEELVLKQNGFRKDQKYTDEGAVALQIKEVLKKLKVESLLEYESRILSEKEPFQRFVLNPEYTVFRTKESKEADGSPVVVIDTTVVKHSLSSLSPLVFDEITSQGGYHYLEAFTFAITGDIASSLGSRPKSYWEAEVSRLFKISDKGREVAETVKISLDESAAIADAIAKAKTLKAAKESVAIESGNSLRSAIKKLVGLWLGSDFEAKVVSGDVRFVRETLAGFDKKGSCVKIATKKDISDIMLVVCARIITGGFHNFTTKSMKKPK